ncbi:MAG: hypothetical protein KY452_08405 [Actinobacteria bacterium]|nr:hypothetical protein [Actinomycetota bacterium]
MTDTTEQIEARLTVLAEQTFSTTPADVVNAVRSGALTRDEAAEFMDLAEQLPSEHPILNDDDPDAQLGWSWQDGEPAPEEV